MALIQDIVEPDAFEKAFETLNRLALGMTASVRVSGAKPDNKTKTTTTLPLSAIYQTGEKPCVWLVKDGKVYELGFVFKQEHEKAIRPVIVHVLENLQI